LLHRGQPSTVSKSPILINPLIWS